MEAELVQSLNDNLLVGEVELVIHRVVVLQMVHIHTEVVRYHELVDKLELCQNIIVVEVTFEQRLAVRQLVVSLLYEMHVIQIYYLATLRYMRIGVSIIQHIQDDLYYNGVVVEIQI